MGADVIKKWPKVKEKMRGEGRVSLKMGVSPKTEP